MRYLLLVLLATATAASAQTLQSAFPDLPAFTNPVDLQAPDDGSNRLFVVEQVGRIKVFEHDAAVSSSTVFLDLTGLVTVGSETGLLGMAFDPGYAQNGHVYVNYTAPGPLRTVVARYTVSEDDPDVADPNSQVILFTVNQPFPNHNAGQLAFGPPEGPGGERYLYVGLGDGGGQNDPGNHGENPATLLGSMLRLDVNGGGLPLDCAAGTGAATVPSDNPLADGPDGNCDEIYAYGLRNPYRYSFDAQDRFWVADVGQNAWEEIDVVAAGDNLGWDPYEGNTCFEGPCDPTGLTFPIHVYPHSFNTSGGFAVIGGHVYDGPSCAALRDLYVYGDNVTGNVWTIDYDGATVDNQLLIGLSGRSISSFGLSEQGDLFLTDLGTDRVYRFDCEQAVAVEVAPVGGPIVIGPGGGTFEFDVTFTNATGEAQSVSGWADADLANGAEITGALGPRSFTLAPGASLTRRVRARAPGLMPAGVSTVTVKAGQYPDGAISSARFTVTKEPATGRRAAGAPATWEAEWLDAEAPAAEATTTTPALEVAPNPVGERAVVRLTLPEAADVRVEVLDVLGRRVALLAEGPAEAGTHAVAWEAGAAPAGVYLVRLTVGETVRTQRITRLR